MNDHDIFGALEELFEEDAGTIDATTEFKNLEGWDSMTFVGLIAMVDERLGIALTPTSILNSTTVSDLIVLLGDRVESKQAA